MACAVVEFEARSPKELPRQRIELCARDADREHGTRNGDVTLQHPGEAVAHLGRRLTYHYRAGDVGGAVLVLCPAVDQEDALADREVGIGGHTVMRDRGMLAEARDGGEGHVLQRQRLSPEGLERLDGGDLGDLAAGRHLVEPVQETHHGHGIAQMRGPRTLALGRVLGRLQQGDRVRPDIRLAAGVLQHGRELRRRGRGVEAERRAVAAIGGDVAREPVGFRNRGDILQLGPH